MLRATLTSRPLINQSRSEATDGAFVGKYYLITRRINTLIVRSPMQIRVEHDRVHLLVAPLPEECFGCNCVRCPTQMRAETLLMLFGNHHYASEWQQSGELFHSPLFDKDHRLEEYHAQEI